MLFRHFFLFLFLAFSSILEAQVAYLDKEIVTEADYVTVTFDAKQGNGALAGYTGDVYAYTGVILTTSTSDSDWKHKQSTWGVNPPPAKVKMTSIGNDKYTISFTISDFYGLAVGEKVTKLVFLFVNPTYTIKACNANGSDILLPINVTHENSGSFVSMTSSANTQKVTTEKGIWTIKFMNSEVVKMDFKPTGSVVSDTSFTVVAPLIDVPLNVDESTNFVKISSSDLMVYMTKNPVKFSFVVGSDTILADKYGVSSKTTGGVGSFKVGADEGLYGTGSRAIPIDRKGKVLTVYNSANYGYSNNTSTLNIAIPFVVSSKGYGLFVDNQYPMQFDLGSTNPSELSFTCEDGNLRYYFIGGGSYSKVIENYTYLTGRQELPPIWTLGYIQSKYGYQTETEARNIVTTLRAAKFPVEGLVLDLYWFGAMGDMGNLNWNATQWPNPTKMMSDFNALGVKTVLITEPYFTTTSTNYNTLATNGLLAKKSDGAPYVINGFWAGNAGLIDITKKEAVDWMWPKYKARRIEGVSGWWSDLGEPETHPNDMVHNFGSVKAVHNIYSLQWAKMLHEGYAKDYSNERLFNLIRSGFAGMQRYSTFPWSGDIARSWSGLQAQVPVMLGSGMTGIGYMHSDAGGFTDVSIEGELFARWIQHASFSPILRIHGVGLVEPTNYPEPYKSIARNYINLRYRFLPYNYTLAYENSQKGIPMARQSDFYEPNNVSLKNLNDQYLWGDAILVAPVLSSGVTSRTVVFPSGNWFDYFTNKAYTSGVKSVSCTINNMPLFVKGGSFIPLATTSVKNTSTFKTDSLEVLYYPDLTVANSNYTMYCDNGVDRDALIANSYELLNFQGLTNASSVEIDISKSTTSFSSAPSIRNMRFIVKQMNLPSSVLLGGVEMSKVASVADFATNPTAWFFNSTNKEVVLHFAWNGQSNDILINGEVVLSDRVITSKNVSFYLNPPVPNPVNDVATLNYFVEQEGNYTLSFYSSSGTLVNLVELNGLPVGEGNYIWDTTGFAQGVYLVSLSNGAQSVSVKVVKR